MIKYKIEKVIDVDDWDKLVKETYGKPYSFQQQDGCRDRGVVHISVPCDYANGEDEEMNDSIPKVINGNEMGVKFAVWLTSDPKEWNGDAGDRMFVDMFWERNFYPSIYMVANDLYEKGLIEKGNYTIDIDW